MAQGARKEYYGVMSNLSITNIIASNIRSMREEAGYTQEDFAAKVKFDRSYYGRIERGNVNLTVERLLRIAKLQQCEPGDLLPTLEKLNEYELDVGLNADE